MDFKRALVRPQKGIYCKPIGRLFKAKRPCVGFELHENSLQTLVDMGISCLLKMESHGVYLPFLHLTGEPKLFMGAFLNQPLSAGLYHHSERR